MTATRIRRKVRGLGVRTGFTPTPHFRGNWRDMIMSCTTVSGADWTHFMCALFCLTILLNALRRTNRHYFPGDPTSPHCYMTIFTVWWIESDIIIFAESPTTNTSLKQWSAAAVHRHGLDMANVAHSSKPWQWWHRWQSAGCQTLQREWMTALCPKSDRPVANPNDRSDEHVVQTEGGSLIQVVWTIYLQQKASMQPLCQLYNDNQTQA